MNLIVISVVHFELIHFKISIKGMNKNKQERLTF